MFPYINKDEFRDWLRIKNFSIRTIKEYLYYFGKYPFPNITRHNLMEFLLSHNNKPCRAFVKNILAYARSIDLPAEIKQTLLLFEIPAQSGYKAVRIPDYISKDYSLAIAQAMPTIRLRFMVLITFYGGLRKAELLNIKPYDFNWEYWQNNPERNGCLKVFGKNNKERIVFIPASLMAEIINWIKVSVAPKYPRERPLFKMSKSRWNTVLHDVSLKLLGKAIHPHTLRHSTATYLMEKGLQIREIQEYLGHASITSTQIYTHVNNEILREKINQIM